MVNIWYNKSCRSCNRRYADSIRSILQADDQLVLASNGTLKSMEEIERVIQNFYKGTKKECEFCGGTEGYNIWNIDVNGTRPRKLIEFAMAYILDNGFNVSFEFENQIICYLQRRNGFFASGKYEPFEKPRLNDRRGLLVITKRQIILLNELPDNGYSEMVTGTITTTDFDKAGNLAKVSAFSETFSEGNTNSILLDLNDRTKSDLTIDRDKSMIFRVFGDASSQSAIEIELILQNVKYVGNSVLLSSNG